MAIVSLDIDFLASRRHPTDLRSIVIMASNVVRGDVGCIIAVDGVAVVRRDNVTWLFDRPVFTESCPSGRCK